MSEKLCWIDTETTGLSKDKNDIIQLAMLIEIDGEIKEKHNWTCKPFRTDTIHPRALAANGRTVVEMMGFEAPEIIADRFLAELSKHVTEDSPEKFLFAGWNTSFDIRFVKAWLLKCGNGASESESDCPAVYNELFDYHNLDTMGTFRTFKKQKGIPLESNKLVDAAEFFELKHGAHEALSDIEVTMKIQKLIDGTMTMDEADKSVMATEIDNSDEREEALGKSLDL